MARSTARQLARSRALRALARAHPVEVDDLTVLALPRAVQDTERRKLLDVELAGIRDRMSDAEREYQALHEPLPFGSVSTTTEGDIEHG